jgi:phosphoribosyl-dephospho-CoA transferase
LLKSELPEIEIEKSHFLGRHIEIDGLKKSSENANRTVVNHTHCFIAWS